MHFRENVLIHFVIYFVLSQEVCYDFMTQIKKISPRRNNKKHFGNSVALSDDYLVVGSKYDAENGLNSGAAYVYKFVGNNWVHQVKLFPSGGGSYEEFGTSVAMDGNILVVGSPKTDINGVDSGSVYVFEIDNGTWVEKYTITPSDGRKSSQFGRHIGLSNNTLVVNSNNVGSLAYVFEQISGNWQEIGKLKTPDKRGYIPYDHPVAVYGHRLVVGRWYDNKNGYQSGSVIIFRKLGRKWVKEVELFPADGTHSDWFGISVAISDKYVAVSSHGDDVRGADGSGSAYVFERMGGNWTETAKLLPRKVKSGDSFGYPVAIREDKIIVGCMGYDSADPHYNSGAVYVFQNVDSNWTEQYTLLPSDAEYNGRFGFSLALNDKHVAVGGIKHNDKTGSVYIFDNNITDPLCEPQIKLQDAAFNYIWIIAVSVPLVLFIILVAIVCVCKSIERFNIERGEDETEFIYQDIPKGDDSVS